MKTETTKNTMLKLTAVYAIVFGTITALLWGLNHYAQPNEYIFKIFQNITYWVVVCKFFLDIIKTAFIEIKDNQ